MAEGNLNDFNAQCGDGAITAPVNSPEDRSTKIDTACAMFDSLDKRIDCIFEDMRANKK